ncbi:MAG: hypothetical protein H6667_22670 [Ardenticatenaceae bacterium]|nr:hypothetical protein [Ardenticatenaceae bacterium]
MPARLMRKKNYYLFIVGVFMLIGCASATSSTVPDITTERLINDQSGLPTQITQENATPQSTATNTLQLTATLDSSMLTVSLTPRSKIISPTPAPTPTLTSEQKVDNFTRFMTENEGCELPCWWGIIPGETKIETIVDRFVPQGLVWWEEWNQLDASRFGSGVLVTFSTEKDIIQTITVWGGNEGDTLIHDWGRYSLDQVLTRYGMPSQVFVYYPYKADPGPSTYHLYLFYETLGIEIDYAGMSQDFNNKEESQVCPNLQNVFRINLFLYQSGQISNIVETVIPPETISFIAGPETVYDLISWEQATSTTLESFYEIFSQPDFDGCFDFKRYWTS